MTIELTRDVDLKAGLKNGHQLQTFEGTGQENGTTVAGKPTGAVWVRCPRAPVHNIGGKTVQPWKSVFAIIEPDEFIEVKS